MIFEGHGIIYNSRNLKSLLDNASDKQAYLSTIVEI